MISVSKLVCSGIVMLLGVSRAKNGDRKAVEPWNRSSDKEKGSLGRLLHEHLSRPVSQPCITGESA
jgi:hypothetical protein